MPLDTDGRIEYKEASIVGEVRFQADPPVCNVCTQEITRQNFGFSCVENTEHSMQAFEYIQCTACTLLRVSDGTWQRFVERHHL